MGKSEITVTCLFAEEGEPVHQILFHSFLLFLKRELERSGDTLAV